jgi:GWxTD domain-containing protein
MLRLNCVLLVFFLFLSCATRTTMMIKRMSGEDRITYYGLKKVASKEELDEYLHLSSEEREEWLRIFWKKKDPTPATPENEFLEEHNRRVSYCLVNFYSYSFLKPWDERGDVYIVYGEPDEKEMLGPSPGSMDQREEWRKINTEVWCYYRHNLNLQFYDEDCTGDYRLVPYSNLPGRSQPLQVFHAEMAQKLYFQKEIYFHDYGGERLDYALNVVKFRQGDNYSMDVNIGLPLRDMGLGGMGESQISFFERMVILDDSLREVVLDSQTVVSDLEKPVRKNLLFVDQRCFNLTPGRYTLAVEIRDLNTQKIGIYKKEFILPQYEFSEIKEISEVVMASLIRPAEEGERKYVKNDLLVVPLPSKIYLPDQTIMFYFEIYDLKKGADGKARYSLDYSLVDYKKKKNIPLSFETSEHDSTDLYQIGRIDASKFSPGEYILVIRVMDLNADKEKKTISNFKIAKK